MKMDSSINTNSPLLTDQYQLVMAYSYWQLNKAEQEAVFHLYFRKHPFNNNYTIACGLERVIEFLQNWQFTSTDLDYLASIRHSNNQPLFSQAFLHYLKNLRFSGDIDAMPEGTVVFPNEPLLRIKAPILQCQLLETPLINLINFSTLVATKASRVCQVAQNDTVVEFGLRRAQGPDGGLMASRAAFIGGCKGTSNVLAGKIYGIPVKGTLAHSWIMAFDNEQEAFYNFAQVMGDNLILLVDTYNTLQGIKNAIEVGLALRNQGKELLAIRLDSGNLVILSQKARQLLDDAGFQHTKIFASGDLDEYAIAQLKSQGAAIDMWGVGTRLVTAYDQPAMNIVYKLAALKNAQGQWDYKIKLSEETGKTTMPGIHQVRRYYKNNHFVKDVIYDLDSGINKELPESANKYEDLLKPIFQNGKLLYQSPDLNTIQNFSNSQVKNFLTSPLKTYPVQLETNLQKLKNNLINKNN